MTIIDTLVTDRKQSDVNRLNALYAEGFEYWTADDVYFWFYGNPDNLIAMDGELIDGLDDPIVVGEGVIRGAYNEWDLNRVGRAVWYIADKYLRSTLTALGVTAKTDWNITSIPTTGDMSAYIKDIKTIRDNVGAYSDTPAVPSSASKMKYSSANNIEKILIDANRLLDNQIDSWRYAGEVIAGEV